MQARYAISRGVCQGRACALMNVSRSGLYYTLKMPVKDAPVIQAMQQLSGQYPRFGSRRIRAFLGREGIQIGDQRRSRLKGQAGLQVPAKRKRRRVAGTRESLAIDVATSIRANRVIKVLSLWVSLQGAPKGLRTCYRQEFVSTLLLH